MRVDSLSVRDKRPDNGQVMLDGLCVDVFTHMTQFIIHARFTFILSRVKGLRTIYGRHGPRTPRKVPDVSGHDIPRCASSGPVYLAGTNPRWFRQVPTVLVGQTAGKRHDQVTSRQSAEAAGDWTPVTLARTSLPLVAKIISCHRAKLGGQLRTKSQTPMACLPSFSYLLLFLLVPPIKLVDLSQTSGPDQIDSPLSACDLILSPDVKSSSGLSQKPPISK
ncbi:hypothetical protein RRG08_003512 [Elysia crispata]|uniref:Uncharacterized protein n=1 Tax=Elysia crispata TaxID=231223 RepID=A0AAE1CTG4_9GAST|nr:hypothetical protein RRG08_003512 [Elysia crispata]